jgi:hypothetical protein
MTSPDGSIKVWVRYRVAWSISEKPRETYLHSSVSSGGTQDHGNIGTLTSCCRGPHGGCV